MRIEQIDIRQATDAQIAALNALMNENRLERLPDDPPVTLDEDTRRYRNIPPVITVAQWLAWDDGALVGEGHTEVLETAENKHLIEFSIFVTPRWRRQGIATKLLGGIAGHAERAHRPLLMSFTFGNVPAGEAFMKRLGAQVGLETHTNQLDLRDLDRSLLPIWQRRAQERASGFDLLIWENSYPEGDLEQLVAVWESMNRAPRGTLQIEDFHWTVENIRDFERSDRKRGNEVWAIVVRERATGNLAGFTETAWHPNRPEIVQQRGTGVLPRYQNLGLGRWMKAAMLEKILRERPAAKRVRTGNADDNAPMLKINQELGFRPFISHAIWQIELPQVQQYLALQLSSAGS